MVHVILTKNNWSESSRTSRLPDTEKHLTVLSLFSLLLLQKKGAMRTSSHFKSSLNHGSLSVQAVDQTPPSPYQMWMQLSTPNTTPRIKATGTASSVVSRR